MGESRDNRAAHQRRLRVPALNTEQFQQRVTALADAADLQVFIVGGYVRDCVMGRTPSDMDFLVLGEALPFARTIAGACGLPKPVEFPKFDTARLIFRNAHVELVGAGIQTAGTPAPGPEAIDVRLRRDLARRDFTFNAMALPLQGPRRNVLIDLFEGQEDIRRKRIRTPIDPALTFADDPVRLLRAVRFAAQLECTIEQQTWQTMQEERERLSAVSQERITEEFMKMLALPQPSAALQLMQNAGLLTLVLPEVELLAGVEIIDGKGHKDVFHHTLQVLDNLAAVSENPALRFAALMHDIAKPRTKRFDPAVGWTFHGHEEIGARMTGGIGKRLRLPKAFREYAQLLVRHHLRPIALADEGVTDSAIRRLSAAMHDHLDDLMLLCRADITSKNPRRVRRHLANFDLVCQRIAEVKDKDALRNFHSPVTGETIMDVCGIKPGPLVGRIKKQIEDAILQGDIPNEFEAAYEYFLMIKDEIIAEQSA